MILFDQPPRGDSMSEERATRDQIIRDIQNMKVGKEGIIVIFSSAKGTHIASCGIFPPDIPMVIDQGREAAEDYLIKQPRN